MSQDDKPMEFDKVDRALELRVIDWLQYAEFEENLLKSPDGSDMAQLTLELIAKRKSAYDRLKAHTEAMAQALGSIANDLDQIGITPTEIAHLALCQNTLAAYRKDFPK